MKDAETHESWGLVGFHRVTGSFKNRLFGCDVDTNAAIKLSIKECERRRDLSTNWYYGSKHVTEVYLSPSQFSQLLTTMNVGDGVPCTITHRHTEAFKLMEDPPRDEMEVAKVKSEFKTQLETLSDRLEEKSCTIDSILAKKSINKEDKKQIKKLVGDVQSFLLSTAPFILDQFQESAKKVVDEAKAEVDATVTAMVMKTGLNELKKSNGILTDGSTE